MTNVFDILPLEVFTVKVLFPKISWDNPKYFESGENLLQKNINEYENKIKPILRMYLRNSKGESETSLGVSLIIYTYAFFALIPRNVKKENFFSVHNLVCLPTIRFLFYLDNWATSVARRPSTPGGSSTRVS